MCILNSNFQHETLHPPLNKNLCSTKFNFRNFNGYLLGALRKTQCFLILNELRGNL